MTTSLVARRVKSEIALHGLTVGEVATITGFSAGALSRRIQGRTDFKSHELIRIASLLNIPVSRLFEPLPSQDVLVEGVALS